MQDVGAQDAVFAGQRVDHHLGHRRAIGEIERTAGPALDPVPGHFGRLVEPVADRLTRP